MCVHAYIYVHVYVYVHMYVPIYAYVFMMVDMQDTIYIFKIRSPCFQTLSTKVETRFCSSSWQNTGQYIGHLTASCSYQHTVQNSKKYFEKTDKIFKI